jgi:beta-lactamase regulating signal transducer with metallopeptidase domain
MDAESLVTALVRVQLAASAAILVVLVLRPLALRWCGAGTAYLLWLVVPLAAMAVLLPAREQVVMIPAAPNIPILQQNMEPDPIVGFTQEHAATAPVVQPGTPDNRSRSELLITLWLLGAGMFLVRSIVNTRRLASSPFIGPALIGVLRPRLVLPPDFETRFSAEERALILAHEERHRASRHTLVNALVEVLRCAGWFNPLLHWAAMRFRADQELACDTAVIAAYPGARRTYAEALLKAQGAGMYLPMGCVWNSGTACRLGERIARLSEQLPGRRRRFAGAASIVGIGIAASYAAWAQQPARAITVQQPKPENAAVVATEAPAIKASESVSAPAAQAPVQTPTAQAPQGSLPSGKFSIGEFFGAREVEREPGTPAIKGEPVLYDATMLQRMQMITSLGYTTEDAILHYAAAHQELWKDPEYRKLVLVKVRPKFERDYPGLARELDLSENEAGRLFDLLADNVITRMAETPIPKPILGRPTTAEQIERQAVERRAWEIAQASSRRQEESIQALLDDKYAQWQAYTEKRRQALRIQLLERGQVLEENMRRNLDGYRPSVTADRPQLEALRTLQKGLEVVAAQNQKMRMELESEGLLSKLPLE